MGSGTISYSGVKTISFGVRGQTGLGLRSGWVWGAYLPNPDPCSTRRLLKPFVRHPFSPWVLTWGSGLGRAEIVGERIADVSRRCVFLVF